MLDRVAVHHLNDLELLHQDRHGATDGTPLFDGRSLLADYQLQEGDVIEAFRLQLGD